MHVKYVKLRHWLCIRISDTHVNVEQGVLFTYLGSGF